MNKIFHAKTPFYLLCEFYEKWRWWFKVFLHLPLNATAADGSRTKIMIKS